MAGIPLLGGVGALLAACGDDGEDDGESAGTAAATGEASAAATAATEGASAGGTIPVGILHSLSGTMAVSEVSVKDAEILAIDEINAAGGVLGMQLEPIIEDGASDWPTFAEKARKLIQSDGVAVTFGCWTSASRKAVLPVYEDNKALLFYPVQYEGLESSPYIYYMGATTNQQIVPSVEYLLGEGKTKFFLLGSDYVFPRTANQIIKAQLAASGGETLAEEYTPLGHTDYSTVISKIRDASPDVVYNTLNGDSNVAFFKQLRDAGFGPEDIPTLSVSVAEEEVRGIGADVMTGHLVAWNYYQTVETPENEAFVAAYKAAFGDDRVTADPHEAAYIGVKLWAQGVEAAGTTEVEAVRAALAGMQYAAPEGPVTVNGENQHISKTVRIGQIRDDGLIATIWATEGPVEPDPYLETYDWAKEFWRSS
ncbi:MAG: urea ABC transporter substrate-binding protein [Dehalococcoidia bacterium]